MLFNATLLRLDDPSPAAPGPALSIRCAVGSPGYGDLSLMAGMGISASSVLYLPMASVPPGGPAVGQTATVRMDGCPAESYSIVHVADQVSELLSHVKLFLAEA